MVGIAGRASGFDHDLRRDFPHAAYDQVKFTVPVYQEGDVLRRMQVRIDEVHAALSIIEQVIATLPDGPTRVNVPALPADQVALGYVEGWRGEIFHWIRTAADGRLFQPACPDARCGLEARAPRNVETRGPRRGGGDDIYSPRI